jgi:hypothetical protein
MVLERETIRYRKSQARTVIRDLLFSRRDPRERITSQDITKRVFPEWREMSFEQYGSQLGFCKRTIGGERMRVYSRISTDGSRPDYFPAAIQQWYENGDGRKTQVWNYLNAVEEPYLSRVIRQMESYGTGVLGAARLLRSVRDGQGEDEGEDNGRAPGNGDTK